MRILQSYRFLMGTKIPFDQWAGIIEQYLSSQNLRHHRFHYYMESFDNSEKSISILNESKCQTCVAPKSICQQCRASAETTLRKGTGCQRALKENSFLGPITVRRTRYSTIQFLHNFDDGNNEAKDQIYPILPKIYRRYGFASISLIYRDIDFFSQRVSTPTPSTECIMNGYAGSGITLYHSCDSKDNTIILTVEYPYPGEDFDATPYANALADLLPGIKRISVTEAVLEEEDKAYYSNLHSQALPLVQNAKDFFAERMPEEKGNDEPPAQIRVASLLQKLGKKHGYAYLGYQNETYSMEKHLAGGHCICLDFFSNPLSADADPLISLCGLGFRHQIWSDGFSPQNPKDAQEYFTKLFDTLDQAEKTVFVSIANLYPTTPEWFMPGHGMAYV